MANSKGGITYRVCSSFCLSMYYMYVHCFSISQPNACTLAFTFPPLGSMCVCTYTHTHRGTLYVSYKLHVYSKRKLRTFEETIGGVLTWKFALIWNDFGLIFFFLLLLFLELYLWKLVCHGNIICTHKFNFKWFSWKYLWLQNILRMSQRRETYM